MNDKHYSMFRATTDKLDEQLNGAVEAGWKIESITWVGGRDWVILTTVVPNENGSLSISESTPSQSQPSETGWVADMNRRHARFDAVAHSAIDLNPASFTHLIEPEIEWGDIVYGRYDTNRVPTGYAYVGWIEDRAKSWIIFLGEHGSPSLYWPRRDAEGGVIGSPIELAR